MSLRRLLGQSTQEHDPRVMQLLGVYDHNRLGQDNLWATIREEVRDILEA